MKILAIETSCDETALALGEKRGEKKANNFFFDFKIISQVLFSQIEIHKKWGGVYPSLAKREHQKNLLPLLSKLLGKAGLLKVRSKKTRSKSDGLKIKAIEKVLEREGKLKEKIIPFLEKHYKPEIDLIAVTHGPGLEPCLWAGVNFTKALGIYWDLEIMPINHIEAHIFASFIGLNSKFKAQNSKLFPAVCLAASGGHTQLILMKNFGDYKILGETLDDAAGEAFDKIAKILGLSYPGGPSIAKIAAKFKIKNSKLKIKLPRPMLYSKNYDFSFSGLKTAVLYDYKKRSQKTKKSKSYISQMAYESQKSIVEVLTKKTIRAAKELNCKSIILGGGVAANEWLKKEFRQRISESGCKINFLAPKKELCTDNAQMIALTACYYYGKKCKIKDRNQINASANLSIP